MLGVSDEGSATAAIRQGALAAPKAVALTNRTPLTLGIAHDAERLGAVLLMAKHTGDDLVAKATEEAAEIRAGSEQMRAEVERERAELAAKARAEADAMVSEAAATVESLGREAEELRQSIADRRQELVAFLQSALQELEDVESVGPAVAERPEPTQATGLDGELLAQLPSE